MANGFYTKGKEGFLAGDIDWDGDDIKVCLVNTATYTVDLATHEDLADVSGIVATSGNLAGKTVVAGVADATDVTFVEVPTTADLAVLIYQDTGLAATSRLICYIDTGTNFPLSANGGDITIEWNASGIFEI